MRACMYVYCVFCVCGRVCVCVGGGGCVCVCVCCVRACVRSCAGVCKFFTVFWFFVMGCVLKFAHYYCYTLVECRPICGLTAFKCCLERRRVGKERVDPMYLLIIILKTC